MAEDRRIKKTKRALQGSLVELLSKKELRQITIQELCDLADVHRATFYYHYSDIYALYDELESQIIEAFTNALVIDETHSYAAIYRSVLNHIYANAKVWSILLNGHGRQDFHDRVSRLFENKFIEICAYETGITSFSQEYHLLIAFETHGFFAMIVRWLADGTMLQVDALAQLLQKTDNALEPLTDQYIQKLSAT